MSEKKNNPQKPGGDTAPAAENAAAGESVVKQRLFILKAKQKNLKNAEQFLKNRDIEIVSTTDMKVAINTILSGQASYIMLSTDHSNPKVMKLPAIIQQTLNTPLILFAEGVSPKGALALRESRHPYVLYPPVSGPAVERMILKIERDRKEKAEGASGGRAAVAAEDAADGSTMKFAGSADGQKDDIVMQNKKAQQEFAKIFAGEGMGDAGSAGGFSQGGEGYGSAGQAAAGAGYGANSFGVNGGEQGSGFTGGDSSTDGFGNGEFSSGGFGNGGFGQGQQDEGDDGDDAESVLNYLNQEGEGPQGFGPNGNSSRGRAGSNLAAGTVDPIPEGFDANNPDQSGSGGFSGAYMPNHSKNKKADGSQGEEGEDESSSSGGVGLPKFIGMNKKGDQYMGAKKEDDKENENASQFKSSKATQHVMPQEQLDPNNLTAAEILSKKGANLLTFKSDDNASFLIKGSKHALESSSKFVQGKSVRRMHSCTKVSCFNLDSSRFSGYVIVAFGEKDKIDQDFNKNIKNYLVEYLKLNGLEANLTDMTALNIKEVNFEEWSIREADFLMTSIHEGSEIALAFFPHEKKEAPLELSAKTDMARMTIDEIIADEPVEFDVYIYLPTNDKYVRYTPQNGIMYGKQKERLKSGGHAKIHIRKESASDLSRYRVQNFLNDKIESFKKAKKTA